MKLSEYPTQLNKHFQFFEISNLKVLKAHLIITMITDNGTIEYHKLEYTAKDRQ